MNLKRKTECHRAMQNGIKNGAHCDSMEFTWFSAQNAVALFP